MNFNSNKFFNNRGKKYVTSPQEKCQGDTRTKNSGTNNYGKNGWENNHRSDKHLNWRKKTSRKPKEIMSKATSSKIMKKATSVVHCDKPFRWKGKSNEKAIAGFCWMSVKKALLFFNMKLKVKINDYEPIVPTNRASNQNNKFLGSLMVRSAIFGNGPNALPEVKLAKMNILKKMCRNRFILLTVYRDETTGKYDADIGAGGEVNEDETNEYGLNRELGEETGKKDWNESVLREEVYVKKKNQNCSIFTTNCDEVSNAAEASTDGE